MKRSLTILREERGQVAPIFAVMILGLVVMVGLVTDGGLLFAARRNLQGTADAASRAGAMAIDIQSLRDSGTEDLHLNTDQARSEVERYLASVGFKGQARISVGSEEVTVELEEERGTLIMAIAGLREVTVRASSSARPRSGIGVGG